MKSFVAGRACRSRQCRRDGTGYMAEKMLGPVDGYGKSNTGIGSLRCVNSRSHAHNPAVDINEGAATVTLIDHRIRLDHIRIGYPANHQIAVQIADNLESSSCASALRLPDHVLGKSIPIHRFAKRLGGDPGL